MSIHPTLRYGDATAAIAFLTTALGFVDEHLSTGEDGAVTHAEPSFGGVAMIGTREPGPWDTGKAATYLAVDDAWGNLWSVGAYRPRVGS